ncbi:MAG TPA: twin-arginine translocase TatA/TatE family subunit [Flavobacteriaceae bacterium]|nr:twin-arginine translocase TatA/TatE family subunit [Flavobacteriaceae bacterium]
MISQTIFLGFIGGWEWIVIAVVILLLFGGKKIPELMKGLGSGLKEFKNAASDDADKTAPQKSTEKSAEDHSSPKS